MANRHKSQKKQAAPAHAAKIESEAGLKRGGAAKGGKLMGKKSGGRLDKRARGGGVGADKSPFSSAHFNRGGAAGK